MVHQVETAAGPIETDSLGFTLIHEHVFLVDAELERDSPTLAWNGHREQRIAEAVNQLRSLKAKGVDTIIDMTVIGLGRQVDTVVEVARQVDLNIVLATGVYLGRGLPDALTVRDPGVVSRTRRAEDVLAELFIRDITAGIATTTAKAGVIKGYTNERGLTPETDRCLRAVAFAHRETGAPINTHSDPVSRSGLDQLRVFAEEGVDLQRVVIGHSGDTIDLNYLRALMDQGATIASDRFGLYMDDRPSQQERIDTIVTLVDGGYSDRLTFGQDSHCYADFSDFEGSAFSREVYPHWVHWHVVEDIVPALLERGVTELQIRQMTVENPRRIFERQGSY